MSDLPESRDHKLIFFTLQIYFLMLIVSGFYATISIVNIPGEMENVIFLGLSIRRLFLFFPIWIVNLYCLYLMIRASWNPDWFQIVIDKILEKIKNPKILGTIIISCILGILNSANFLLWIPEITEPVTQAYYYRLEPIIYWAILLCGFTLVQVNLIIFSKTPKKGKTPRGLLSTFLGIFVIFAIIWFWVGKTGYGVETVDYRKGWTPLGVPILEIQILLAWGFSTGLMILWPVVSEQFKKFRFWKFIRKEAFIWLLLWLAALWLWMAEPLEPNWFASEPRPPNNVFYPNSDSSVYDITALNLLMGEGFKSRGAPYTIRPVYALGLAFFHTLGGLDYEPIIWMHVAVLAWIPVFLYAIGRTLHNRFSGLMAAFLVILRERNAIALGGGISDSHAKLLMPFLPTMLGVVLLIWVVIEWLKYPTERRSLPLLTGGIVGVAMLIRPECGVLLPFVGLAALFELRDNRREWVRWVVMASLGLIFSLGPWLWRNYQLTGTVFIDLPDYRLDLISRRYREKPIGYLLPTPTKSSIQPEPTEITESIPTASHVENVQESFQEVSVQSENEERLENVFQYVNTHTSSLLSFILGHFMNSVVQTVQSISPTYPISYSTINFLGHHSLDQFWEDCCSIETIEKRMPYWRKWDGRLLRNSILPIGVNLALISMGIAVAWKNHKFIGIVPLFAAFGYYLINALVRNSGGRYIIPVNWVGILYFSIGILHFSDRGIRFFKKESPEIREEKPAVLKETEPRQSSAVVKTLIGIGLGIFFIGALLPIAERWIPNKRSEGTLSSRIESLLQKDVSILSNDEIEQLRLFLANNGMVLEGYAFYPRFHQSNQMGSVWDYYQERPYPNLDFYLSSPTDKGIVIRLDDSPDHFPHVTDVVVFACPNAPDYDALVVITYSEEGEPWDIIWRTPTPDDPGCPFPPDQK